MNIIKKILITFCTSMVLVTAQAFSCVEPPILPPISPGPPIHHGLCSDRVVNAFTQYFSSDEMGNAIPQTFRFEEYVHSIDSSMNVPYSALMEPWAYRTEDSCIDMRIYFLDRSAGYVNHLGIVDTNEAGETLTYAFEDVIAPPPALGDMVQFILTPGDTYSLFLLSETGNLFRSDLNDPPEINGFQHFLFLDLVPNLFPGRENWVVGAEDLLANDPNNPSDYDYNDCTFIISFGKCDYECKVPEPGTWLLAGSLLALALVIARKRKIA